MLSPQRRNEPDRSGRPGPAEETARARRPFRPDSAPDQLRRAQASRFQERFGMCPVCGLWKLGPCGCRPPWWQPLMFTVRRVSRALRTR